MRPLLACPGNAFATWRRWMPPRSRWNCALLSLVHDDPPAMDDDALRRGQPTVHVAFDEATAILAGDALQSLAFEVLARAQDLARRVAMLAESAQATGAGGMCGGQAMDIAATGQANGIGVDALQRLLRRPARCCASVRLGRLPPAPTRPADRAGPLCGCARPGVPDPRRPARHRRRCRHLGKTAGKDVQQDKATFPALLASRPAAWLAELGVVMD
jgi:farnesyl diphosphate synthase